MHDNGFESTSFSVLHETTMVRKRYTPPLSVTLGYDDQQVLLGATKQTPAHPYAFITPSVPGKKTYAFIIP